MPRPFNDAVITTAGAALLLQVETQAASLEVTRIAVGAGTYSASEKAPSNLRARTALKSPRNSYVPTAVATVDDSSIKITALISNYDPVEEEALVTSGYYINEVGIYCKASTSDTEVLYCIAVTSGGTGDYMPAYSDGLSQITQDIYLTVGNASAASVNTAGAAFLDSEGQALKAQVAAHLLISEADGTAGSDISDANIKTCHLIKQGNRVRAYVAVGYYDGTTTIGINTTLFTIPEGFRPAARVSFPVFAYRTGGTAVAITLRYNADGTISQSAFSNITALYGTAEWSIS